MGIRRSSTLQSRVPCNLKSLPAGQASAKLTPSHSIRATGRLGRGTNPDIVHKKLCIMIWASNYWSTGFQGSMRVFWLVSKPRLLSPAVCFTDMCDGGYVDGQTGTVHHVFAVSLGCLLILDHHKVPGS